MKFKAFPKIPQFRNAVKDLQYLAETTGKSQFKMRGTVKLHGTNAAIGYDAKTQTVYAQSRTRIITPDNDNYGFAQWVKDNEYDLLPSLQDIGNGEDVILYGEWCGKGVQKGVGISELDKMFVIFRVEADGLILPLRGLHVDTDSFVVFSDSVYFIDEFKSFNITIDITNPESAVPELQRLTEEVEKECPVAKAFDVSGVGEGIVWELDHPGFTCMFKVKGEKHAVSKVKTLAAVDPEKLANIQQFVEYAATENRLQQGIEAIGLSQSTIGAYIGWVNKDIWNEEKDVLEANGLQMKEVAKMISTKARLYYLDRLNKLAA